LTNRGRAERRKLGAQRRAVSGACTRSEGVLILKSVHLVVAKYCAATRNPKDLRVEF
jgi:hypothetical protein